MSGNTIISRRAFLTAASIGAAGALASACTSINNVPHVAELEPEIGGGEGQFDPAVMYASMEDGGRVLPAIPYQKIDPIYYRQIVADPTGEMPGTVVVDPAKRFLYVVQDDGQAVRYGVGVGKQGFAWSGRGIIQWKQKWPKWTPPSEMIARQPELAKYSAANGGMAPGLMNPLGARALYIFKDGKDTLYRLHGSPEWWSIGHAVSSGCIRLMNQDVIDLYNRVPVKSPILVI